MNSRAKVKSPAKEIATIKRLEMRLQLPSVRSSPQQLDQLLADDFLEFGSSGKTYDKPKVIAALVADPSTSQPRYAALNKLRVTWLADDTVLLNYRSSRSMTGGGRIQANRSSIWKRIDGRWQMLFHQGTPLGRSLA
jgi:hypothetical protein